MIIGSATKIAYESLLASTGAGDNRAYSLFIDELEKAVMGVGEDVMKNDISVFYAVINKGSQSLALKDNLLKMSRTSKYINTAHLNVEGNKRERVTTEKIAYGGIIANCNIPCFIYPLATYDRFMHQFMESGSNAEQKCDIFSHKRKQQCNDSTIKGADMLLPLKKFMERNQYILNMYTMLSETGFMPRIDSSVFARRVDAVAAHLKPCVLTEIRGSRVMDHLLPLARVATVWRALFLCFDLGFSSFCLFLCICLSERGSAF